VGGLDSLELGYDLDFMARIPIGVVLLGCARSVDVCWREVWFLTQQSKLSLYFFRVGVGRQFQVGIIVSLDVRFDHCGRPRALSASL
jgi:hypothetical protein